MTDPLYKTDCGYFDGARPCFPYLVCNDCEKYLPLKENILYIHTGAMGDIVRQMSVLESIIQDNTKAAIEILSLEKCKVLFNELIQRFSPRVKFYALEKHDASYWMQRKYKTLFNLDRDTRSSALASTIQAEEKKGFKLNENGSIGVFNSSAELLYKVGLDDKYKFTVNKLKAHQLIAKAMDIVADPKEFPLDYAYKLTNESLERSNVLKNSWKKNFKFTMGINLGVGKTLPLKSLSERLTLEIIDYVGNNFDSVQFLLLGGEAETFQVKRLLDEYRLKDFEKENFSLRPLITDSMTEGSEVINALDLMISSDTLALHLGLSLKTPVITWFGPTNIEEIPLELNSYPSEEGGHILSEFECSPCWNPVCNLKNKCNDSDVLLQKFKNKLSYFFESSQR